MNPIMLFKSYSDEEDIKSVSKVIKRGIFWAKGPEIKDFENNVARFCNRKYAIAFNSGTSALTAILKACDVRETDEVIVPSFTFPATVNAVIAAGAIPVFADIEPETLGLDIDSVREKITGNTIAILPIHFAGNVSRDIEKLRELADEKNIYLIEDNAHSIGATLNKKCAGSFGHAAMLSFCFNKTITTGEGGMALIDDIELANKIRLYGDHGQDENREYIFHGVNLRMSSMAAALGLSQFAKIDYLIKTRRKIAKFYNSELKDIPGLILPIDHKNQFCTYQTYNLIVEDKSTRDMLKQFLAEHNISSRITYFPVHEHKYFLKEFIADNLPVTKRISSRILTIPLYPGLTKKEMNYVATMVKKFFT